MFGLCKDCKYWVFETQRNYGYEGFPEEELGLCDSPEKHYGLRFGFGKEDRARLPKVKNLVLLEDDIGWSMMTGPEFGCNHFSPNS